VFISQGSFSLIAQGDNVPRKSIPALLILVPVATVTNKHVCIVFMRISVTSGENSELIFGKLLIGVRKRLQKLKPLFCLKRNKL